MALIQFGKKEIEQLEIENERLRKALAEEEALREHLNALLIGFSLLSSRGTSERNIKPPAIYGWC